MTTRAPSVVMPGPAPQRYPWVHVAVLLVTLVGAQAPRLSGLVSGGVPALRGFVDFDYAYYPAGQAIVRDPSQLYRGATYDAASDSLQVTAPAYFVNIPIVAWLFVPFGWLPRPAAEILLLMLNVGLALASLVMLQRRLGDASPARRWLVTGACATSGPLLNALNLGQTTPWVLWMLLRGEACLHAGREARAGLWLGGIGLIKVPPLLLLPYLAWRRRWRVLIAALAVLAGATLLSVSVYGWALHATYFDVAIRANLGTAIAAHNCQSIDAGLARLFTTVPLWSWQPFVLPAGVRLLKWALLGGLVAACAAVLTAPAPVGYPRMLLELAMVLCAAVIIVPVSWVHYGAWVLPVAVALGGTLLDHRAMRRAFPWLVVAMVLVNLPVPPPGIVRRFGEALWFRVAISHQLIGALLLLGLCIFALQRMARLAADTTARSLE